MRISSFRLENYKCFLDSGEIPLGTGMNLIVGKNDAGKSALVESLSLSFSDKPTRNLDTVPFPNLAPTNPTSRLRVTYEFSAQELTSIFNRQQTVFMSFESATVQSTVAPLVNSIKTGGRFHSEWSQGAFRRGWLEQIGEPPSFNNYAQYGNRGFPSTFQPVLEATLNGNGYSDYAFSIGQLLQPGTYAFRAERMNVGECGIAGSPILAPNAINLPDVLNQLSSKNLKRYERLMEHIRVIFPHITQITAPVISGTTARILVWSVPIESERDDLAVPLADSGTGIGQVLAMLYVVVTSDTPKIIIIDEPQSFLHPGAVRKLLEILRAYPQHQYLITTHSPLNLNSTENDRVLLVKREPGGSTVTPVDPDTQEGLRTFLSEVGARLGDVFGADSILWVEGKTEETCFPEIIKGMGKTPLQGIQILGVISTGELEAKFASRVYDIYARLSGGTSLLPPAVAFVFDREGRSDIERADIDRKSNGLVHWLPRRMYENYLLEPTAIASVLNSEDVSGKTVVTEDQILTWLKAHGSEQKYFSNSEKPPDYRTDAWSETVHGAKILHDMFPELSGERLRYDKVKHGLMLTRHLIEKPTTALTELSALLVGIIKNQN